MDCKKYGICTAILYLATLSTVPLVAETVGEEWEYEGNMQMMGMSIPVPMTRVCQEADQDMTPPTEGNCEVTDIQTQGDTTSFNMRCGPPEPMEGSGTTTRTDDHVEMNYTMNSSVGEMAFHVTGKRLGSCTL